MFPSLNTAVLRIAAVPGRVSVIGNNIANVDTTGFKGSRVLFEDTFSQALNTTMQVGSGVSMAAIQNDFGQGSNEATGIGTNLFINGQGFFTVRNAADKLRKYVTRSGIFKPEQAGICASSSDCGSRDTPLRTWDGGGPDGSATGGRRPPEPPCNA